MKTDKKIWTFKEMGREFELLAKGIVENTISRKEVNQRIDVLIKVVKENRFKKSTKRDL